MSQLTSDPQAPTISEELSELMAGPPEEARGRFTLLAHRGIAPAQTVLGQMLLDGFGGEARPAEALDWFIEAAAGEEPMAYNMAGRCYENGWGVASNLIIAAQWYRQAADRGLDWGMYNYATRLMLGDGVAQDRQGALSWFQRAADLGHVKSINVVGGFYEDGWEVDQDFAKARECYERAALGGDFRGQFNLGRVRASEGDVPGALALFRQAAETATPPFITKMVAFLQGAPIAAYRDLGAELEARAA